MIRNLVVLVSTIFSLATSSFAQVNFFHPDTIQKIEITFSQSNWDYMMDTAKAGAEGYLLAQEVKINGLSFDSAGVKYKGYSSFDSARIKNPLHIKFDYVKKNSNYTGYEDAKLSNGFSDPSSIREVLAYEILGNYMDAPQSNFAAVYINGVYYGIYTSSENIDKNFLGKKIYSSNNTFVKCNPANVVSGQIPNLLYFGTDSANYYSRYELKSQVKWKDLIDLCDTLNNNVAHIDSILDVDRALWMLAFNNLTVNLDSYTGAFSQNYYLYRDGNNRFVPIIWDLNMCFGGFSSTGSGTLNLAGMQNMTPVLHSTNGAKPLIMNLLANPTYNKMYIAHMRTIDSEFFANANYLTRAQALQAVIDTAVQSETYSLYTYSEFQGGLTTNNGSIPGISNLMTARSGYLNGTTQFAQQPPVISSVTTSPVVIYLNDTIWITCKVLDQSNVWLGYRDQVQKRFRRIAMFDDGLHQDGIAGDSIFGASLLASSAEMQYYIYAENANAGVFSPERAEHEFYKVQTVISLPTIGDVVINEFMADNVSDTADASGQYADWIELYNTTASSINMYGLYLTDDFTNPKKFSFPNPTIIPANGFLTIWADEDPSTVNELHGNFNISAFGEELMLGDGSNLVLDSISFGFQPTDSSMGRCPDGTGFITNLTVASLGSSNCTNSFDELFHQTPVSVYPNPVSDKLNISFEKPVSMEYVEILNSLGQIVGQKRLESNTHSIDVSAYHSGLYALLFWQDGEVKATSKFIKR